MKKKILAAVLATTMILGLAACGSNAADSTNGSAAGTDNTTTADTESTPDAGDATVTDTDGKTYTIGISQFAEHGSLDNCREGFLAGLAEEGIVEEKTLPYYLTMHRQTPVPQAPFPTTMFPRKWI